MTAIDDKWHAKQWLGGAVDEGAGSDERPRLQRDGRLHHLEGGSIHWRADIGAYEVHGAIGDKWASLGWQDGRLGYPLSDERGSGEQRGSTFQRGAITWTPAGGAVVAGIID